MYFDPSALLYSGPVAYPGGTLHRALSEHELLNAVSIYSPAYSIIKNYIPLHNDRMRALQSLNKQIPYNLDTKRPEPDAPTPTPAELHLCSYNHVDFKLVKADGSISESDAKYFTDRLFFDLYEAHRCLPKHFKTNSDMDSILIFASLCLHKFNSDEFKNTVNRVLIEVVSPITYCHTKVRENMMDMMCGLAEIGVVFHHPSYLDDIVHHKMSKTGVDKTK